MTPREVIEFFGGTQQKAAERLGIRQSSISEWCIRGYVPLGRQYEYQILTGGALRADPDAVAKAKEARREPV